MLSVANHQFSIGKGLRAYGIVFVAMLYFDSAVPLMLLHGIRYMRCVCFAEYTVMSSFICVCFACTLFFIAGVMSVHYYLMK